MSILNNLFKKETTAPIANQNSNNLPNLSKFNKTTPADLQNVANKAQPYTTPVPKATAMTLKKLIIK